MQVCTLASSSSGNATIVIHEDTKILIDAGISMRRIVKSLAALDIKPEELDAVLVTHEHSDHIGGLVMLTKYFKTPVYAPERVAEALCHINPGISDSVAFFPAGTEFELGCITVKSFPTPHDTPESVGYRLMAGQSVMAFATDLGHVPQEVLEAVIGADLAVIESNHDVELLKKGPYPQYLKRRILAKHGHLSNFDSGTLASKLLQSGTKRIVLAHLSKENNTPRLAYETVGSALCGAGAKLGHDIYLHVAPADDRGECYIV